MKDRRIDECNMEQKERMKSYTVLSIQIFRDSDVPKF